MSNLYIVFGLGNPGSEYAETRHNTGRDIVARWCKQNDLPEFTENKKFLSLVSEGRINKSKIIAALPQIFMNNSGKAVSAVAKFYKAKPRQIIIVHDDMDIPVGRMKISVGKSAGGHKGVASCLRALKTLDVARFRIGTGKSIKWHERDLNKLVIAKFSPPEEQQLKKINKAASGALTLAINEGVEAAMNEYNQQ
ncbi:MAG: aminoacyl-tRNA hydrolase [Candidatus Terrybacteria bacterium RIFCSPLOWO2_01_FULL_44_24]|uniref:Aminoacyl-tRNA hydrolase n=1 Tax=Candidatus Terrybacteria bacterium RIFCSPHIGHO2_01_FULL_43_35 TaxID=1802361 RepID=A0A1G2PE24_9BACT|nr:MAG: aminoacyl-tRNA hydrolase [Candidatus Terrybacteria bacterium RIFCSPHIGHO2_01_FULL_43_35]OHA50821.1 MAG: aminoacyl-tRNA hydrolase [Candidatus Terrybacteria bacterium RIFCSPLOWO2_01_FULL_44_24]